MLTVRWYGRSSDLSGDVVRFIRFGSDLVWLCWYRVQFCWFRPSSGKVKDVHSRIYIEFRNYIWKRTTPNSEYSNGGWIKQIPLCLPPKVLVCSAPSLEACILRMALRDRSPPPPSQSDVPDLGGGMDGCGDKSTQGGG